jgi:hypothetical protein
MEAANVVLVPALAVYFGWPGAFLEWIALAVSALAASSLLVVGAIYWFGVSRRLRGDRSLFRRWLAVADQAERPILALIVAAAFAVAAALVMEGWTSAVIAALVLVVLAVLEYINYYRWQLQHFDNWADFRRLLSLSGLKRAHSARELATYRASLR